MPLDCGSTRVSTAWVAMAASMAAPPRFSIACPAWAASGCAAATMYFRATTGGLACQPVAASGWAWGSTAVSAGVDAASAGAVGAAVSGGASPGLAQAASKTARATVKGLIDLGIRQPPRVFWLVPGEHNASRKAARTFFQLQHGILRIIS